MNAASVSGPTGNWVFASLFDYFGDPPRFLSGLQRNDGDIARFNIGKHFDYPLFDSECDP